MKGFVFSLERIQSKEQTVDASLKAMHQSFSEFATELETLFMDKLWL